MKRSLETGRGDAGSPQKRAGGKKARRVIGVHKISKCFVRQVEQVKTRGRGKWRGKRRNKRVKQSKKSTARGRIIKARNCAIKTYEEEQGRALGAASNETAPPQICRGAQLGWGGKLHCRA